MMNFFKIFFWLVIPLLLFNSKRGGQNAFKTITHELVVNHPGEKKPVKVFLEEIQNAEGLPVEYTMDVYSVICLEEVCKIIPVKLFWNNIGVFKKYELEEGETLEKYEADLFEPEDYIKLQSILSNIDSPFKDVYINEILTVPNEHGDESVDAVSGATALELNEEDTVPGAALTCYTLWHWANGEVVSKIKTQTGKSASIKQLQELALNDNNSYFEVALNEFQKRNEFSKSIINTTIEKSLKEDSVLRSTFKYLKNVPTEFYFYAVNRLFFEGKKEQKLAAIQSLRQSSYKIPDGYLDNISKALNKLDSYQEVSLLLGLMESKNLNSKIVIENALPMLNADFLMARRVYWFLKSQELNAKQTKQLQAFYNNNKNRF